jgi:hypothetical protein
LITTGVVGQRWRASITAWGGIEPWDGSPPLDWYVAADDRWHLPRHEPAVRQTRVDGTPVTETRVRVPGGDVVHTVYSCADSGGVTVVEVVNESSLPVAIAFDRRDVLTERPIADMPINGIELPAEAFVMPVGHRARIRVGLAHAGARGGPLPALPEAAQVARGWVALAERASRFVLPDGERGAALVRRVVTERCEVGLGGLADPVGDPAGFVVGAGELWRAGEVSADDLVGDIASAVEVLGGVDGWEADVALGAATRLLAAAGEARAVRDVERILAARPESSAPTSPPEGAFAVPWLESQIAVGGALFPHGLPPAWWGESIEAHGVPTGPSSTVSLAVRWHGARPAALWEQQGAPVRLTSPVLAPTWNSTEQSGETLWPAPG